MLYGKTIAPATLGLLKDLQKTPGLQTTRLVGGTGLALQIGHRVSVDLDLFTNELHEDFLFIIDAIRKQGYHVEIRKQSSNILIAMINNIKVDIVNYPYDWLDKNTKENDITLASIKDIAAMKLSAITNRGTKKDFTDLYYLLKKYSLPEMISFYEKKYNDSSTFMVLKSLTYFDDADLEISPKLFDKKVSWQKIKQQISTEVQKLS